MKYITRNYHSSLRKRIVMLLVSTLPAAAFAQGIVGSWKGVLDVGGAKLNLVFHIKGDKSVTMDSPDQGAMGIPTTVKCFAADSLCVEMEAMNVVYSGKLVGDEIKGTFSQMGYSFPLNLKKGEVKINRPQTPLPPFPYQTKEVSFENKGTDPLTGKPSAAGGAKLAGTLTLPEGFKKGMPVVLMVTGSGQQNRDEELMGHKPFLVIADWLARHGIASLRYDDRGVEQSTGDADKATTYDNMLDALAGIEFLKNTKEFGKIGVLGHSEGGTIGYMLAAKGKADFVVSLAGPALRGDSILLMQNRDILKKAGLDDENINKYVEALRRIFQYKTSGNKLRFASKPEALLPMLTADINLPEQLRQNLLETMKQLDGAWLDYFISYEPAEDLKQTKCPVMLLGGDRDTQVRAKENISAAKALLPKNSKSLFKEYPNANHLFQPSTNGMPLEYGRIETTIQEEVLKDIATWIQSVAK